MRRYSCRRSHLVSGVLRVRLSPWPTSQEVSEMEDFVELLVPGGWGLAIGVGVGVALLAGRQMRPVAKAAVKGYMAATEELGKAGEGLQRATAGAKGEMQDLYAEAKAERAGTQPAAESPAQA